ncbi:hypothetical protein CN325_03725 [Bacillus thuringiensis]|uniref:hypothetical protein n=1 Tax=Bacillus thuringiensis TaxID=1428 RepID=UPI000BF8A9E2|nr:hypothetical protein [Bacillus thuringiensis]PFF01363.1 hypothetical protein CN325_03725 [Bacillus thuringiensis]
MYRKTNNILDFVDSLGDLAFVFSYDSDTDGIRIFNNQGLEMNPEQANQLVQGLTNFYSSFNEEQRLDLNKKQIEQDIMTRASWYGSLVKRKEFRKNLKRHWTFYCEVCREKVSSSTHQEWWTINWQSSLMLNSSRGYERCCSENCGNKIAEEIIQNERARLYNIHGIEV